MCHRPAGPRSVWRSGATTNTAGYTLWGFKPASSTVVYTSRVQQVTGSSLDSSARGFASAGYLITTTTTNTAGYTLWGFKPSGSTSAYSARCNRRPAALPPLPDS